MTIRTALCLALLSLSGAGCQVLRSGPGAMTGPGAAAPAADATESRRALRSKLFHHLSYHQGFPAGRDEILRGLASSTELTDWERDEITRRLGRYPLPFSRVGEVMTVAGLGKPCAPAAAPSAPLVCSR